MHIKAAKNLSYNGFTLDPTAIQLHSVNAENICLPYVGSLPDKFKAQSAYIAFQPRPNYPKFVIVIDCADKQRSYIVECANAEIMEMLDSFLYGDDGSLRMDTGLDLYWLGFWVANYENWRFVAT